MRLDDYVVPVFVFAFALIIFGVLTGSDLSSLDETGRNAAGLAIGGDPLPPPPAEPSYLPDIFSGRVISFVDSAASSGTSTSIDIGYDQNRLVLLIADHEGKGTSLSGATVDGQPCSYLRTAENSLGVGNHLEAWFCDEDALASSSGIVTASIEGADESWGLHVLAFSNVSQDGAFDSRIDNTSAAQFEILPAPLDVPKNGLVVFGAASGMEGTSFVDLGWDTNPTETADDEQAYHIELLEATDGEQVSSSVMGSAYWISDVAEQSNRQFRARLSAENNRGTGIIASWAPYVAPDGSGDEGPGDQEPDFTAPDLSVAPIEPNDVTATVAVNSNDADFIRGAVLVNGAFLLSLSDGANVVELPPLDKGDHTFEAVTGFSSETLYQKVSFKRTGNSAKDWKTGNKQPRGSGATHTFDESEGSLSSVDTVEDSKVIYLVTYEAPELETDVYQYLEINSSNETSANITFTVSDEWLAMNDLEPANVTLFRNVDGSWVALPTTYNGTHYSAETEGFSFFAIGRFFEEPEEDSSPEDDGSESGNDDSSQDDDNDDDGSSSSGGGGFSGSSCDEKVRCASWSACIEGQQRRSCTDICGESFRDVRNCKASPSGSDDTTEDDTEESATEAEQEPPADDTPEEPRTEAPAEEVDVPPEAKIGGLGLLWLGVGLLVLISGAIVLAELSLRRSPSRESADSSYTSAGSSSTASSVGSPTTSPDTKSDKSAASTSAESPDALTSAAPAESSSIEAYIERYEDEYSEDQLRQQLLDAGWNSDEIDEAFKAAKKQA